MTKRLQDISFGLFLALSVAGFAALTYMGSGPVILGSELNTNGKVEYLCLGSSCDSL
tara:strand:+ start:4467 stop:4637 length:171 start_codon:yes stop_codon:yes gene_type:complete